MLWGTSSPQHSRTAAQSELACCPSHRYVLFASFFSFGFLGCCLCNCCGRTRVLQHFVRRRRDAMPFMDMVQNRGQAELFNPLMFVYPFLLITTCILGGTLLVDPSRTFLPAGPPAVLRPLCTPVFTEAVYAHTSTAIAAALPLVATGFRECTTAELAESLVNASAAKRCSKVGAQALSAEGAERASALAQVLLDLAWSSAFSSLDAACDGRVAVAVAPNATTVRVPRVSFALRDAKGHAAALDCPHADNATAAAPRCGYRLRAALRSAAAEPGRCGASLRGEAVEVGSAGVGAFDELELVAEDGAALCPGEYELLVSATAAAGGASETAEAAEAAEVAEAALSTNTSLLLVSAAAAAPTFDEYAVELPELYDAPSRTVTRSTLTYTQHATAERIRTVTATNVTTSVHIRRNGTATLLVDRAAAAVDGNGSAAGAVEELRLRSEYTEEVHERRATQVLGFVRPPPRALRLHEDFAVTLALATETGIPLPAQQVQAVVLGAAGTGIELGPGATAYTDEAGVARLTLRLTGGRSGEYLLLFGSAGTLEYDLKRDVGALVDALSRTTQLWHEHLAPLVEDVAAAVESARSGALRDLLVERTKAAIRAEFEAAAREAQSCQDLASYLRNQSASAQTITVDVAGLDPNQAGAGGPPSLSDIEVSTSLLDALRDEEPGAAACVRGARGAAVQASAVYERPDEFAETLVR